MDFSKPEYDFSLKPRLSIKLSCFIIEFHGFINTWDDDQLEHITIGDISGHRINLKGFLRLITNLTRYWYRTRPKFLILPGCSKIFIQISNTPVVV